MRGGSAPNFGHRISTSHRAPCALRVLNIFFLEGPRGEGGGGVGRVYFCIFDGRCLHRPTFAVDRKAGVVHFVVSYLLSLESFPPSESSLQVLSPSSWYVSHISLLHTGVFFCVWMCVCVFVSFCRDFRLCVCGVRLVCMPPPCGESRVASSECCSRASYGVL